MPREISRSWIAPAAPHGLVYLPTVPAILLNGNDLLDVSTGKKFASFDFSVPADAQYLGAGTVALIFQNPDHTSRLIVARIDAEKLRKLTRPAP